MVRRHWSSRTARAGLSVRARGYTGNTTRSRGLFGPLRGPAPRVGAAQDPETIHDFRGFPEELYQIHYQCPGDPQLARAIASRLGRAGFAAKIEPGRGLDHGIWSPLALIWPAADIPVIPLSVTPGESPLFHYRMGQALSDLRADRVMLIGSGAITHNLRRFFGGFGPGSPEDPGIRAFADWIAARVETGDVDVLLASVETWPDGRLHHPTDDHILPLFFAMGAGLTGARSKRLHASTQFGILAMDVLGFGLGHADMGKNLPS